MDVAPKSELLERAEERREATYLSRQREPLGASYVRGHAIPPQLLETGFGKPGEVTSMNLPAAESLRHACQRLPFHAHR